MSEFQDIVLREQTGQVVIGIDRTVARKVFTDVSVASFQENIGEVPYLEKTLVFGAFIAGPLALLASAVLAIVSVGWWSALLIPAGVLTWVGYYSASSRGGARMTFAHLAMLVAVGGIIMAGPAKRDVWVLALAYATALWLGRFAYSAATVLVRRLVIRNRRAFDWLRGSLTIREVR